MGIAEVSSLITNLGFPIAVAIGLAFFTWKLWNNSETRNTNREERLNEVIENAQKLNEKLSKTNAELVNLLDIYKEDLAEIKTSVTEIKFKISKGD